MSNKFDKIDFQRLERVHPLLFDLALRVVIHWPCRVVYGLRTYEEQVRLYNEGLSKTINSLHLPQEDGFAHAIDLAPKPIDWNNQKKFYYFAGRVDAIARDNLPQGWRLRWGGNWDMDFDLDDQKFMDLVHFELRRV